MVIYQSTSAANNNGPFSFAENIVNKFVYLDMFHSIPMKLDAFLKIKNFFIFIKMGRHLTIF